MFESKNQLKSTIPFWVLFGLYAMRSLSTRITDSDLWWHLASGRIMVENHTFLRTDVFSHTLFGAEWINFEWLGQVVFYLCTLGAGVESLFVLKMIMALLIVVLMAFGLSKLGARGAGLLLGVLTSFFLLRPRLNERVELFSLLFLPAFVFLLAEVRNRPVRHMRKVPWILFGLMVLWCNLHGGFVYGVGVVVLFFIGSLWSQESRDCAAMMRWSLALVLLATLINPYGPRLFLAHIEHLTQLQQGLHIIQEWAPPSVRSAPFFWVVFLTVAVAVVVGLVERRSEARFWAPAVVVFSVWAGLSNRNMALLVFTGVPFLSDIFSKWERLHKIRTHVWTPRWVHLFVAVALLTQYRVLFRPIPSEKVQWNRLPSGACEFVHREKIQGTMFNSYEFGGYIEWDLGPEWPVFMDGRYLFHSLLTKQSDMNNRAYATLSSEEWQAYLSEYNVDYAITNMGDFFTSDGQLSSLDLQFPRAQWALVYWDDTACVFVRRQAPFDALIKENEYRVLRPFNWNDMANRLASKTISLEDIQRELAAHKSRVGFTVTGLEMEKRFYVE